MNVFFSKDFMRPGLSRNGEFLNRTEQDMDQTHESHEAELERA